MNYYSCDFETTVYQGQEKTDVWAAIWVNIVTKEYEIYNNIYDWFNYFATLGQSKVILYFHNLKFDGEFILYMLLHDLQFKDSFTYTNKEKLQGYFPNDNELENNSFKYSISDRGMWYKIVIKVNDCIIEIRDSLKLLPFSVKSIGDSFQTEHKKLSIEYEGFRKPFGEITEQEKEYIKNDALVVAEALEIMFKEGHKKLTIGSCCLSEFKLGFSKQEYAKLFPNLYDVEIDPTKYKYANAGEYIKASYKGGWCYVVKGKENKIFHSGLTADVNSLYPSVMSSESECYYPYGMPTFWSGNYIPDEALKTIDDFGIRCKRYYFIRVKTRFYLKPNMLPVIQIKGNFLYPPRMWLETSDIIDYKRGKMVDDKAIVEMVLTCTDFELIKKHYDLVDFEILDGCYFKARTGIFDDYIEKYKRMKLTSKGARRQLAKLFLNNLYGKMATSTDSSFKVVFIKENGSIGFIRIQANDKKPGYIAIGSAITSWARNFTITAAQKNYHGVDKKGFIYADTDSIHCDCSIDELIGVPTHEKDFCKWKIESQWSEGYFVRAKTYIEKVIIEDGKEVENGGYYNIKVAGLPERAKRVLNCALTGIYNKEELTDRELKFVEEKRYNIDDLKPGLEVPGSLKARHIKGGIVLYDDYYTLRG